MRWVARLLEGQRAAAGCAVVACDTAVDRCVFVGRRAIVSRGEIGDRIDGNIESSGIAATFAIADGIGDRRHRAVPVGIGREGIGTGAANGNRADTGDGDGVACRMGGRIACNGELGHAQRIAIGIAVVAQDIATDRCVLVGAVGVVRRDRCRVGHCPVERLIDRGPVAIGGGHGDAVHAARTALTGRVVDRSADDAGDRIDRQPGRQTAGAIGQRRAVDVGEERGHIQ